MSLEEHSASGSAAGYVFQFERALYWLAKSPEGFRIGIETCDDVAILGANGEVTLEQDKHSVRQAAKPLGDRSKDLWNTLSIWYQALKSGEIKIDNSRFLLVTNQSLGDCLAETISKAVSKEEVDRCIDALRVAAKNPSETIRDFVETLNLAAPDEFLRAVIRNCQLLDGRMKTAGSDLRTSTISELQIPDRFKPLADSIVDELHGWVSKNVLLLWQEGRDAWISRDSFVNQFFAIVDERKRHSTRERSANLIPIPDDRVGKERERNFVKQLYLVTDEDSRVDDSIRDFIRSSMEKTRLSAEGNVTDQDWVDFEDALSRRWKTISSTQRRLHKNENEEDIGFRILSETTDDHRESLAGVETEQIYLTAGTYHLMADALAVGWHPRFKELLEKEGNE